jgi:hypothetical protein
LSALQYHGPNDVQSQEERERPLLSLHQFTS